MTPGKAFWSLFLHEWLLHLFADYEQLDVSQILKRNTMLTGLDISQGTEANGRGALKNSFHIFHLPRPCPDEMALKMGALQFSYVKPGVKNVWIMNFNRNQSS
jgi:hypothetical protein